MSMGVRAGMTGFERVMWWYVRLWLDDAHESLRQDGVCPGFVMAWLGIGRVLARQYVGRPLTWEEDQMIKDALLAVQYPG